MTKPVLLDLFSGAGGAARGYQMSGFRVVGVDIKAQPRYAGDEFHQADALAFVAAHGHEFDAIHASPPCQAFSRTKNLHRNQHVDLIDATRTALEETGAPWVIENVDRAPLRSPIVLCGAMFGLRVYRHRKFESNILLFQPRHPAHLERVLSGRYSRDWEGFVTVAGGGNNPVSQCRAAMGIDWMSMRELVQAIPPAYSQFVGTQLLAALANQKAA